MKTSQKKKKSRGNHYKIIRKKAIKNINKNQMENLELKTTVTKIKSSLDELSNRLEMIILNWDASVIILNITGLITKIKGQR